MTTDPSFEGLPTSVIQAHQTNKSDLDQLAQRETQREPVIPQHYALSLSELRAQQASAQQVAIKPTLQQPTLQKSAPLDVELDGDILEVTTVTELCEQASKLLVSFASKVGGNEGAQLEVLGRKLALVKVHPQGELSVIYAKAQRAEGRSWQSIAESLNEMMLEKSVYKPLRSASWNGRSLKSLVHLRAQND